MRGSRVQAVVNELQGEKIDIIPWSPDIATFVVNALAPAEVAKVVLDEERERIEVVVPEPAALARDRPARPERAARLAAHRLGHRHPHRAGGIRAPPGRFREAHAACSWKRSMSTRWSASCWRRKASPRSRNWRWSTPKEIAGIEGFDEDTAQRAADARARISRADRGGATTHKRKELGVDDALKDVPGVTARCWSRFGENDIKTVEDLAGCATDDLVGWTERKDGESHAHRRHSRRLRALARRVPRR